MKKRLKIVICDDEATAISIISASVDALLSSRGISAEILTYTSAKECYRYLRKEQVDVLFLDIAMPEADGIYMAKKLLSLKLEKNPDIIFVSSNQNRVFDSFQVLPFGFVRKENFMKDISDVMTRYVESKMGNQEETQRFELRDASGVSVVRADHLLYIESYRNRQTVHLTDGKNVILHSTMDNIYEQVKDFNFIRIHKSYIAGCRYIRNFGRNEIVLSNEEVLPVGRIYYKNAMEQYMTYIRMNGIQGLG